MKKINLLTLPLTATIISQSILMNQVSTLDKDLWNSFKLEFQRSFYMKKYLIFEEMFKKASSNRSNLTKWGGGMAMEPGAIRGIVKHLNTLLKDIKVLASLSDNVFKNKRGTLFTETMAIPFINDESLINNKIDQIKNVSAMKMPKIIQELSDLAEENFLKFSKVCKRLIDIYNLKS